MVAPFLLRVSCFVVLASLGALLAARAELTPQPWTYETFKQAYAESGRKLELSSDAFETIQQNKGRALASIEQYLKGKFGSADPRVLQAFAEVPREYYHYQYAEHRSFASAAYEEEAKPWPIGYGSVLSDYLGQAYMTQLIAPQQDSVVLEIGTGSGFQSSLLSRLAKKVYSIEIIDPLGRAVSRIYAPLHYDNVKTRVGDGYYGWPEVKEGFDMILVTCSAEFVPPPLLAQLKPGGRMVIPMGQPFKRGQILYVFTKDEDGKVHSRKDIGVFFMPMTGASMKHATR